MEGIWARAHRCQCWTMLSPFHHKECHLPTMPLSASDPQTTLQSKSRFASDTILIIGDQISACGAEVLPGHIWDSPRTAPRTPQPPAATGHLKARTLQSKWRRNSLMAVMGMAGGPAGVQHFQSWRDNDSCRLGLSHSRWGRGHTPPQKKSKHQLKDLPHSSPTA